MDESGLLEKVTRLCLNNAKQYLRDAEFLYSSQSYGHALALTVLSDIEVGKSVIYYVCSQGMITEEVLPPQFISYLKEKQYDLLASETWWLGLVLASNVDVLVPILFRVSVFSGTSASDLSQETRKQIFELVEELKSENEKIFELHEFASKSFFVNLKFREEKVDSPSNIMKSLVKERLEETKKRIENGEPFLFLSFSEKQKKIAQEFLKTALESLIPIRKEIKKTILPIDC